MKASFLLKWKNLLFSFFLFGHRLLGFPGGSDGKESACSAGDLGSVPGWERSPGEGIGNPLQYSCLENPMDRVACWVTVHVVAKRWARLSMNHPIPCLPCWFFP